MQAQQKTIRVAAHFASTLKIAVSQPIDTETKKTHAKISDTDKTQVFVDLLKGATFKEQASKFSVSIPTIHNVFWRNIALLKHYSGEYTFKEYYNIACSSNTVRASCTLEEIRLESKLWLELHQQYVEHIVTEQSPLIVLGLNTKSLIALGKYNVYTVADYLNEEEMLKSAIGIGVITLRVINDEIKHLQSTI